MTTETHTTSAGTAAPLPSRIAVSRKALPDVSAAYGTPGYWAAVGAGLIPEAQAVAGSAARQERSERARAALRSGARAADPRATRPAPEPTRQYVPNLSVELVVDQRLTPGARGLGTYLRARASDRNHCRATPNNAYLADRFGVCERTIQRWMAQLRRYGYVATELARTAAGWVTGRVIALTGRMLPYFHPQNRGNPGTTYPPSYNRLRRDEQPLKVSDALPIPPPPPG